jgi:hypothetical protein
MDNQLYGNGPFPFFYNPANILSDVAETADKLVNKANEKRVIDIRYAGTYVSKCPLPVFPEPKYSETSWFIMYDSCFTLQGVYISDEDYTWGWLEDGGWVHLGENAEIEWAAVDIYPLESESEESAEITLHLGKAGAKVLMGELRKIIGDD